MSLYKERTICCFYLLYRLGKFTHSASDYVKQASLKVLLLLSAHISILSFWSNVILTALEAKVTDGDQKHPWSSTSADGITTVSFPGGTQPSQISLE